MAKIKVRVLDAVVDGKGKGEVVTVEERSAKHLVKLGYVEVVGKAPASSGENKDDGKKDDGGEAGK